MTEPVGGRAAGAWRVYSHTLLSVFVHSRLFLPLPFAYSLCAPPACFLRKLRWNRPGSSCPTFSPTTTIRQNTTELYCRTEKQLTLRDLKLFKLIIILPQKLIKRNKMQTWEGWFFFSYLIFLRQDLTIKF